MPATYAHYRFGQSVYQQLPTASQALIDRFPGPFLVGLHGPDILFHYHPFQTDNPVIEQGDKLHREPAAAFFQMAEYVLPDHQDREPGIVYLLGFFCHFMLDSACHPLVREAAGTDSVRHNQVETELDRRLMERQGLDPLKHNPTRHLHLTKAEVKVITRFYPGLTNAQIAHSVWSMRRLLSLLVVPGPRRKRWLIFLAQQYRFHGLVMPTAANPEFTAICQRLTRQLDETVPPTARLLVELANRLSERQPILQSEALAGRMAQNFG